MKRKVWIFLTIGLTVAVAVGVTVLILVNRSPIVWEFDLEEYQEEIAMFPSDKHVGPVEDASTAIEKAKELWTEKFGPVYGQPYDPLKGRKIEVSFDEEEDCWLITTRYKRRNVKGACPSAIIRTDGTVLVVWMR